MKVAVVGLDSADWTLLDRWSSHLPNISMIRREGVSGPLESCRPPVTIPAWKCYSTGKYPGKLGVFWFAYPDFAHRTLELNLPGAIGGNLWDLIPNSLVINTPGTFPPRTIDGTMIAGFPCRDGAPFVTPPWVLSRLNGYRVNSRLAPSDPGFPEEALELTASRFALFNKLAPRHDFGQVTIFYIDELHHLHGSDSAVFDAWRLIDEEIGRIIDFADNVVLVSDHGSGPLNTFVNVVPTLKEIDAFRTRGLAWKSSARLVRDIAAKSLFGEAGEWTTVLPPKLRDAIAVRVNPMHEWIPGAPDQFRARVDWSSSVVPLNQGLVYRNPRPRTPSVALEDVAGALHALPGVVRVWRKEDLYHGPMLATAPDLWVETEPGVEIVARFDDDWVTKQPERGSEWIGNHRQDGIFAFYGKDVLPTVIDRAKIVDMCPTILASYGLAPPATVDGTALPVWPSAGPPRLADDTRRGG